MNQTPKRQAVVVGLFVAFGTVILAGGVLTIGDINDTFSHKLEATAVFGEVNGLKKGDNIWFSGVKVGVVKGLVFRAGSLVEVSMKIDEDVARFIPRDALAKLGSDGLIGNKLVVLYGGTPDGPTLKDGDVLTIGSAASTEEIMATLQENNENLLAITTDLKAISGKIAAGEGTIGKLLADDVLYTRVVETVDTLESASSNAETLTASLGTFANKLNQKGGLPNDLVTDRTTWAALSSTATELQKASGKASELMGGLAQGAADPATPVGLLMQDKQAATDLSATLENLNQGSALLAEDLEALQSNFLFRRYFRKKAKAEAKARDENEPRGRKP